VSALLEVNRSLELDLSVAVRQQDYADLRIKLPKIFKDNKKMD
jgi:hypothetical protein